MNEEQKEKNCRNCRYYIAHFIISHTRYYPITGHCVNDELIQIRMKKRERDRYRLQENCGFWEPIEIKKAERREEIKETLRHMEKSLSEIAMILQYDEEGNDGGQ